MTPEEATKLGYRIVAASAFEAGLVKNGKGVRTWWSSEFDGKLPGLDHPRVQEAIILNEEMERDWKTPL